jgi:hypothetical protein
MMYCRLTVLCSTTYKHWRTQASDHEACTPQQKGRPYTWVRLGPIQGQGCQAAIPTHVAQAHLMCRGVKVSAEHHSPGLDLLKFSDSSRCPKDFRSRCTSKMAQHALHSHQAVCNSDCASTCTAYETNDSVCLLGAPCVYLHAMTAGLPHPGPILYNFTTPLMWVLLAVVHSAAVYAHTFS